MKCKRRFIPEVIFDCLDAVVSTEAKYDYHSKGYRTSPEITAWVSQFDCDDYEKLGEVLSDKAKDGTATAKAPKPATVFGISVCRVILYHLPCLFVLEVLRSLSADDFGVLNLDFL